MCEYKIFLQSEKKGKRKKRDKISAQKTENILKPTKKRNKTCF